MNKNNLVLQLFLDCGTGFNEENSLVKDHEKGKSLYEFDISGFDVTPYGFRLDPLNASCVLMLGNNYIIDKDGNKLDLNFQFSNADIFDRMLYFAIEDPQIYFFTNKDIKGGYERAIFEIYYYYANS